MDDLVIRGGSVLDGTGAEAVAADVAIRDGRITAIVPRYSGTARREIDARGSTVAPGFIDIKTHSDFTLPYAPARREHGPPGRDHGGGRTLRVLVGPGGAGTARLLQEYLAGFAPWIEVRESTFADYLDRFPATSVNTIMQVGHNTLRLMTTGMEDRAPTEGELSAMKGLLEEGLAAGALGLSSGLFTAPGSFARPDELLALLEVVRRHGGAYATHLRSEGPAVFEAVREAIEAGERSGVHVQIVHMKLSGIGQLGTGGAACSRRSRQHDGAASASTPTPTRTPAPAIRSGTCSRSGCRREAWRRCWSVSADQAIRRRVGREIDAHGLTSFGRIPSWDAVSVSTSRTRSAGRGAQHRGAGARGRHERDRPGMRPAHRGRRRHLRADLLHRRGGSSRPCSARRRCWSAPTGERWPRTASPGRGGPIRASTGPSRACWAGTRATWACCRCLTAVHKMTGGRPRSSAWSTAGSCGRAIAPT